MLGLKDAWKAALRYDSTGSSRATQGPLCIRK
jgi:hypothetical protein